MSYTTATLNKQTWRNQKITGPTNRAPSYPYFLQSVEEEKEKYLPMTVLSDSVFGTMDDIDNSDESYYSKSQRPLFDDEYEQLELPLENPNLLLRHYKKMIHRYERGFERMAGFALRWYYLEHDAQNDEVIGKMFRDIQVLRKLSGHRLV